MTSFLITEFPNFIEHDIGYQPSKFQCSRMSGSNLMEGGGTPVLQRDKKPSAYMVNIYFFLNIILSFIGVSFYRRK